MEITNEKSFEIGSWNKCERIKLAVCQKFVERSESLVVHGNPTFAGCENGERNRPGNIRAGICYLFSDINAVKPV